MEFPFLPEPRIERAALELLGKAFDDPGTIGPCVDLDVVVFDHLVEKEGLYFSDEFDLGYEDGDKILGQTQPVVGKMMVCRTVKQDGPVGRYRFTLGHELGHWILHRPLFLAREEALDLFERPGEQEIVVTSLNRNVFPSGYGVPTEEWQANRFAVALLVNVESLRREFEARFRQAPIVCSPGDVRGVARKVAMDVVSGLPSLAETFGLSTEAMSIALETRGYLTDSAPIV